MICGSQHDRTSFAGNDDDDLQKRSLSELIRHVSEEEVQNVPEATQRRSTHEVERLRREKKSFKDEFKRLNSEQVRLEDELPIWRASGYEGVVAGGPGLDGDVYGVLVERKGRGGGEKSLEDIFDELTRKIDGMEVETREMESWVGVWGKKYEELEQRVLQLEKKASMSKNEELCVSGSGEEQSAVLQDPDGLINMDACADGGSAHDSTDGGTVSVVLSSRKKLDFGTGGCSSPLVGSNSKSPLNEDGVLQGDGRTPLKEVEVITIDDDTAGPGNLSGNFFSCHKPTIDKDLGWSNQERGKRELKRKRCLRHNLVEGENSYIHGSGAGISWTQNDGRKKNYNVSIEICSSAPVSCEDNISFTKSVRDVTMKKQHEPKNIEVEGKDSKNCSSKLIVLNSIALGKKVGSGTAKQGDGSSLHGGAWKNVEELLLDLERDDELCMKAVCALYRRQNLARKAMDKSICQGFSGLRVLRGIFLGEFLTDREPQCKLKRSMKELQDYCPRGVTDCRNIAIEHSNQLFSMYQKKEDPYFKIE